METIEEQYREQEKEIKQKDETLVQSAFELFTDIAIGTILFIIAIPLIIYLWMASKFSERRAVTWRDIKKEIFMKDEPVQLDLSMAEIINEREGTITRLKNEKN